MNDQPGKSAKPDKPDRLDKSSAQEGSSHSAKPSKSVKSAKLEASLYLVDGTDQSLVDNSLVDLLERLCGDLEPSMVVEEYGGPDSDPVDILQVAEALSTPPFVADRRIVVLRQAGKMPGADISRLVSAIDDMTDDVFLVIAGGERTVPASLRKRVGESGVIVDATSPAERQRPKWIHDRLSRSPIKMDPSAENWLQNRLGEDIARLDGLLGILVATYGEGAVLSERELEPFVGEAGVLPSWDLTDAIDAGNASLAIENLHRLVFAGEFYPLAILTILYRHYEAALRLDGLALRDGNQAAEVIGVKSKFLGEKALRLSRQLGYADSSRAISLLAQADLDLRGKTALPAITILEILVGRLSKLRTVRPAVRQGVRQGARQGVRATRTRSSGLSRK